MPKKSLQRLEVWGILSIQICLLLFKCFQKDKKKQFPTSKNKKQLLLIDRTIKEIINKIFKVIIKGLKCLHRIIIIMDSKEEEEGEEEEADLVEEEY